MNIVILIDAAVLFTAALIITAVFFFRVFVFAVFGRDFAAVLPYDYRINMCLVGGITVMLLHLCVLRSVLGKHDEC